MKNKADVAIITSLGIEHTQNDLDKQVIKIKHLLSLIEPETILISNKDEFLTVSSILAAIKTNTSFFLLPEECHPTEYNAKMSVMSVDLIISDYLVDKFYLAVNLKTNQLHIGEEFKKLISTEELSRLKLYSNNVFYYERLDDINYKSNALRATATCFHKGFTKIGYKYSIFNLKSLRKGISKAASLLKYNRQRIVYYESIDLIHDLVNGILAPLQSNCSVHFVKDKSNRFNTWEDLVLYSSSYKLEEKINNLIRQAPQSIKSVGLLKTIYLTFELKKLFGLNKRFKHIILSGKIKKHRLLNLLFYKIVSLYTMCEVASFVSFKKHNRLEKINSVGKPFPPDEVKITANPDWLGSAYIKIKDMAEEIKSFDLNYSYSKLSDEFLPTGDIVTINKRNELIVLSKANLMFEIYQGKLVKLGEYMEFALNKNFVKNAKIIKQNNRLVMLVEPDVEYLDSKKYSIYDFIKSCEHLEKQMFTKIRNSYPVYVSPYLLQGGINEDVQKLFTRGE